MFRQGGCHEQARHIRCNDPRGRWRLLRSGGAGRRCQDVHRPLGLYRNGLSADLVRHHALRRDRRGLHLPDSRAPLDTRSPPGSAYIVQRYSRSSSRWDLAPNGLQNSFIGIKGTEPIGGDTSVVFALDAGFDPYSFRPSSGAGSAHANAGTPQDQQTSWADSSRAGQWYNGNGYVGFSSKSFGTLTVFRQNALTYDGVLEYDPMGASYAFSPIGWQGLTCGGGNTENCRHTSSLKYRLTVGQARVAAIWQFGGYGQNNASNGAYQFGVGGDIPHLANGVLSFDAIL